MNTKPVSMTINGTPYGPVEVPDDLMMLSFLHDYVDLTGTKFGCGIGVCHACVVIWDKDDGTSETLRTCITGAHFFDGKKLRTVEGHARYGQNGAVTALSPVQAAFLEHFSFQCGYCTPGFVNAATVMLEDLQRSPVRADEVEGTIDRYLGEHICRCTGYVRYYQAAKDLIMNTPGLVNPMSESR